MGSPMVKLTRAAVLEPNLSKWKSITNGLTREEIREVILQVGLYRPIADAARVTCPLLVCVGDRDDLTPPEPAVRVAERAPRGELRRYDADHWSPYPGGEHFDAIVADQAEFLTRHLG